MIKRSRLRIIKALLTSVLLSSISFYSSTLVVSSHGRGDKKSIKWASCPLKIGNDEEMVECTQIAVPLRHEDPDGAVIEVAVKRKLGKNPHQRQLWFLDGGPGDSGRESLAALVKVFADIDDLDLYTFDHRGVGGTKLLDCPEQQSSESEGGQEVIASEWDDCIEYLRQNRDDLDALTTTQTAQDLGLLVELFRKPNVPVFVMGVSYGTYLTNRYLQLFPHQPDGIIIDGLVPADWSFSEFDAALDLAGRKYIAECDKNPDCSDHFRAELSSVIEELIQDMDAGHINRLGLSSDMLRLLLGNMLMIDTTRAYIPALLLRLERFSWYDKMAILHLFRLLNKEDGIASEKSSHSQVLQRHVALSEIWGKDAPSLKKLEEDVAGYIMTTRVSTAFADTAVNWPVYEAGSLDDRQADYDGPLLMLHGGLDPTIPPDRLEGMRRHFSAPQQHFVLIPQNGHVVINESLCAQSIYRQFLDNPTKAPDTSCVEEISSPSFTGDEKTTELLFGTKDYWGIQVTLGMRLVKLLYHGPALIIAGIFVLVGFFIIGRTDHNNQAQKPFFRMAVAAIVWVMVFFLWRLGGIILPYLLDHRALLTIALALLLSAIQIGIGVILLRWVRLSPALKDKS